MPPLDDRRPIRKTMLPEVVVIVLQELYKNSRNDFLVSMRVCQEWHGLAVSILWTDVFVQSPPKPASYSSLAAFTMSTSVVQKLGQIRSFTWLMAARTSFKIRMDLFARLSRLLPHMTSLTSFSFTARMDPDVLAISQFTNILISSPPTTRYLELVRQEDSCAVSLVDKCSVFEALGKALPQLHNLRLGGISVCSAFFKVMRIDCPHLQSIFINFQEDSSRCRCEIEEGTWNSLDLEGKLAFNTNDNALADIRSAVDLGYLPKVRRLVLVGRNESLPPRLGIFPNAFVADVLKGSVQLYPSCGTYHSHWMRYRHPDTGIEVDIYGLWTDISELLERSEWIEYENNVRLPEDVTKPSYLKPQCKFPWYQRAVIEAHELRGDRGGPASEL